MNVTVLQENLSHGLSVVSHLASRNTSLPILNTVLVSGDENRITLSSTNLEIGVRATIRGKVDEAGSIAIPARTFADFVTLAPTGKITLVQEELALNITTERSKTTIRGQSAEEFPLIPVIEDAETIILPAKKLSEAVSRVLFAVAQDDSRPEISGVFIHLEGKTLTLVATDSYRLAECVLSLSSAVKESQTRIIPARTLQELSRILSDGATDITMRLNENQVMFSFEGVDLVSRLIEGQYPDYKQIIPSSHTTSATLAVEPLTKAVKTAGLFSKTGINDITVSVEKVALKISSTNSQLGESETSVEATIDGAPCAAVFNHRYLLDGLQNMGADKIDILFIDDSSPGVLRPSGADDYTYILMPIKQ